MAFVVDISRTLTSTREGRYLIVTCTRSRFRTSWTFVVLIFSTLVTVLAGSRRYSRIEISLLRGKLYVQAKTESRAEIHRNWNARRGRGYIEAHRSRACGSHSLRRRTPLRYGD